MTRTPSQQAELDHLIHLSQSGPAWREYAEWKARDLAHRMPKRWGWMPTELSAELSRLESKHSPAKQRGRDTP